MNGLARVSTRARAGVDGVEMMNRPRPASPVVSKCERRDGASCPDLDPICSLIDKLIFD